MKCWVWIGTALVVLAGTGLFVGIQLVEGKARKQEDDWKSFVAYWEARGESFAITSSQASTLPDEDEFIFHPWIQRVIAGDPAVLERLEKMNPDQVDGYDKWESETDENDAPKPMSAELAQRIRDHGKEFKPEMDAFAEAVRRKGFFLGKIVPTNPFERTTWMGKLNRMGNLLACDGRRRRCKWRSCGIHPVGGSLAAGRESITRIG